MPSITIVGEIDTPFASTMDMPPRGSARTGRDNLIDVVAELSFGTPTTLAALSTIERTCEWCFEIHRVHLVRLLLSRDRMRAILVFRAPDAESVRLACQHAQIAFERIWPCG